MSTCCLAERRCYCGCRGGGYEWYDTAVKKSDPAVDPAVGGYEWYDTPVKKSDPAGSEAEDGDAESIGPAMMTRVVVNYDPGTPPGQ